MIVVVQPPPPPVLAVEWQEQDTVYRLPGGRVIVLESLRYGSLAVHATLPDDPGTIVLTHLPSRIAIVRVETVEDAVAIAERLWDVCHTAWTDVWDVNKSKIPADVEQWIRRCNAAGKMVEFDA